MNSVCSCLNIEVVKSSFVFIKLGMDRSQINGSLNSSIRPDWFNNMNPTDWSYYFIICFANY